MDKTTDYEPVDEDSISSGCTNVFVAQLVEALDLESN